MDRWHRMTQAKILREKGVPDLPRSCIQGMALKPRLHSNGTHLFPKMLLGIPDDLLGYVVRQRVVCLIISVAERSLPLWNLVQMLCQPRAQVLLHRGRQL